MKSIRRKTKKWIGIGMVWVFILSAFTLLVYAIWSNSGYKPAIITGAIFVVVIGWISVAAYLISENE